MINTEILNLIFFFTNMFLLIASVNHIMVLTRLGYNTCSVPYGGLFEIVIVELIITVLMSFLGFIILGNLNDFYLNRILNLIGAKQRLKIVGAFLRTNLS